MDHSGHGMSTSSAMAPAATGAMGGGHAGHGGMGMGDPNACKIDMLWNWNTINACFIARSWKITSKGMFAGSCIGVILLVMSLEFLRRVGYEYDNYLDGRPSLFSRKSVPVSVVDTKDDSQNGQAALAAGHAQGAPKRTILQHTLRSLLHMVQFGVAYFVMLLAMYYNGYIIICILIGAFLGSFVFSWKPRSDNKNMLWLKCMGDNMFEGVGGVAWTYGNLASPFQLLVMGMILAIVNATSVVKHWGTYFIASKKTNSDSYEDDPDSIFDLLMHLIVMATKAMYIMAFQNRGTQAGSFGLTSIDNE
ncbi:copper transporter complex subunit Ctr4 [Ophidiomyces ophidiicola]|nr:copper transporter complex subunit Ctr4 [Ophidiomyces ophidiicola]KAI1934854.1 copper transporter complex subunit Ctr4 [Ophidiomyces ophidiicola]